MKTCSMCRQKKPLKEYCKRELSPDKLSYNCSTCSSKYIKNKSRTIDGMIRRIYLTQKSKSIKRGHIKPSYNYDQLKNWIISQSRFEILYKNWVESNYNTDLRPSCDRLENDDPYSLDNMRLVTWKENNLAGNKTSLAKTSRKVIQKNKKGKLINGLNSIACAGRELGIHGTNITQCCGGNRRSAGGFIWEYA